MFFTEDHLRITKVRTSDGISPIMDEQERAAKKVIFAPLNKETKKLFEDQNTRLPNGIKMKIEVVPGYKPQPVQAAPSADVSAMAAKIAELEAQNKALKESVNGNASQMKADKNSSTESKNIGNDSK